MSCAGIRISQLKHRDTRGLEPGPGMGRKERDTTRRDATRLVVQRIDRGLVISATILAFRFLLERQIHDYTPPTDRVWADCSGTKIRW